MAVIAPAQTLSGERKRKHTLDLSPYVRDKVRMALRRQMGCKMEMSSLLESGQRG